METLFYGMYTVLFWHCIYILRCKAKSTTPNQPLFVSAIVMYVLATGLIITDFACEFVAFILHGGTLEGPTNYFEQFWIWSNLVRESLFVTMVFIADAVLVFRLCVVWGYKKYIVIGPIILLIAEIAFASLSVWGQSINNPGATIQNFDIFTLAMVSFSIICSTNIIVTALIAARIWWYSHQASQFLGKPHSRKYYQAITIIPYCEIFLGKLATC
ncbi:hypothetical protein GYMLUDRAFT_419000 [Collybiopsis luxurians FD-317 M1]|uniref:Uncharacterized protein n=1 Tax=Collybiopsis luxurians FD-317 M1 TaxID=944289 RepID=A0A0D0C7N6_9AGAR|nr:hypothetical protein GYMLUDRAFT_419000 [Collybiopsis luxurians FD-317 M1]